MDDTASAAEALHPASRRRFGFPSPVVLGPRRSGTRRRSVGGTRRRLGLTRPLSMRWHVVAAMIALATASVGIAGVAIRRSVDGEVAALERSELRASAARTATAAAFAYRLADGWSRAWVRDLIATERRNGHEVVILGADRLPVEGSPSATVAAAERVPVTVAGHAVGTVLSQHTAGVAGIPPAGDDRALGAQLRGRVDTQILQAGVVAGLLALLLAIAVALRLIRPLRRVTEVARRMAHGEIEVRAAGSGGPRETKELAVTLDRLAAALRRQEELRRATVNDLVHELRNGLVGVVGRIEALQDGVVVDEEATLDRMARDARRLNRLVDDVLLLAEAQKPSLLVRKRLVDLRDVCVERATCHADRFADRGIAFEFTTASAMVDGDPERLSQIVDNLLSNALRYTDPGERVRVHLDVRDGHAVLRVTDSGIGIAPEHLPRIFDRFWRDPQARDRVAEGSGIGLALVRDLVLAHDGRIEVESRPGEGSRFSVFLPIASDPAPDAPLVREPAAPSSETADGATVWRLRGEIDTANAAGIHAELIEAVIAGEGDVVLDLGDVTFIDSSGLGLLVEVAAEVHEMGGHLTLVAGPPHVMRIFDVLHVDELLDLVETRGDALARLDDGSPDLEVAAA